MDLGGELCPSDVAHLHSLFSRPDDLGKFFSQTLLRFESCLCGPPFNKKGHRQHGPFIANGRYRIRTCDPLIKSQLLCQLS